MKMVRSISGPVSFGKTFHTVTFLKDRHLGGSSIGRDIDFILEHITGSEILIKIKFVDSLQ
jgi:hypothetical protein